MKNYQFSARITMYACRVVIGVALVLLVFFPSLTEWYHQNFRPLHQSERIALIGGFYACAVAALLALWKMDQLLRNILSAQLFIAKNVSHIRCIRWCCLAVSIICLCASFGFPSLLFLGFIMAFMSLVITVVGQAMKAGVELREENDLTV